MAIGFVGRWPQRVERNRGPLAASHCCLEYPARWEVERRHIGLVADDRRLIDITKAAGPRMVEGQFLEFLDP